MAKVDPERRAQIGQEKRAKTRAQLISAATSLFAKRAVESVTVDDIVNEARVAKGTFYVHFDDLNALTVAVADGLVRTFDATYDVADERAFAERCEDDRHHFRFIISPEVGAALGDLKTFTRELMRDVEKDNAN